MRDWVGAKVREAIPNWRESNIRMKRIHGSSNAVTPASVPGTALVPGHHLLHCLALLVIVSIQAFEVTPDFVRFINSPLWLARPLAWTVLFAALGQGLARSRAQRDVRGFLVHRLVRDWVPLTCVVLAMAGLVGPLITDRAPRGYVADPALWTYLGNLAGFPQFSLPGVFEFNNESRTTLGLLWSVPAYGVLVAAVAVAGDRRGWRRLVAPAVAVAAVGLALVMGNLGLRPLPDSGFSRAEAIGIPLAALLAGLLGASWTPFHLARPRRRWLLAVLAALAAAAGLLSDRDAVGSVAVALALAVGGNAALLTRGTRRHDWDLRIRPWMPAIYCAWLVSFPVQQLVVIYGPPGFGAWRNLVVSVPVAMAVGVVLWRLLAEALVRCGAGSIIGPARLPLGAMAVPRYSRRWWLARLRELAVIGAWSMALALLAAGLLALALLAFQPDRIGV